MSQTASSIPRTDVAPVRTCVKRLTLSHFRNYHTARIEVDARPIVLVGPNGAGKTNILEAISLLTPGRGLRRATLADMDYVPAGSSENFLPPRGGGLRWGGHSSDSINTPHPDLPPQGGKEYKGFWAVAAEVQGPQGLASIGTGREELPLPERGRVGWGSQSTQVNDPLLDPPPRRGRNLETRVVKIDGKTVRGQTGLARVFTALWLTPQMDNLFLEGGTARRKFLDRLVYSFDAEHASRINAYELSMRERNRLLAEGGADAAWLAALEQKMAEQGVAIAVARTHAAEGLSKAVQLSRHSFPQAALSLSGLIEAALAGGSALKAEENFRELLAAGRAQDAAAGRTLTGIHRTQVEVTHVEKNMPAERCSTGEQKALLISIILAQARAGAAWHGCVPVLLLDEVSTHLDPQRRAELYNELAEVGAQAWLTGTDEEIFKGLDAQRLAVNSGTVKGI
jgi:DNA replication and repair protein RecF